MRVCPACAGENDDPAVVCATCGDIIDRDVPASRAVAEPPRGFAPPDPSTAVPSPTTGLESGTSPTANAADIDTDPLGTPLASLASLAAAIEIAERSGRIDLASGLSATREQIRRTGVTIAVVGEFKKGKSSLVNALVNAEVCPADPVDATVVPITVSHGAELRVTVERLGRPPATVDLAEVATLGSEAGNEANQLGVTRIEIAVPRRLLAAGLVVVDTPGVGGLESAAGVLNLAIVEQVDGVLFVTDCSQELTAPELTFLAAARERCPAVVCVMSKLDLHLSAAVLADRNRRHLVAAGLDDIVVLTVSSVLQLLSLAQDDAQLETESGFAALFDVIRTTIWEPARAAGLAHAGERLAELADHLAMPLEAAQRATSSVEAGEEAIARLTEARDRVRQLRSDTARWRRLLGDGIRDAAADLDDDLRARLRTLARAVEARVAADDRGDDHDFEPWVQKLAIEGIVAHYHLIADRTNVLTEEIGQHFATLDRQAVFHVEASAPTDVLAAVHLNRERRLMKDGVARRLVTTGQGYGGGLVVLSSVVGVVSALPWIPLVALPFAGFVATRAVSEDRRRSPHGVELGRLATSYLEEVGVIVHQDSRDTVRRIELDIGEHFAARAEQLERTTEHALEAAVQARGRPLPAPLDHRTTIDEVRSVSHRLVAGAAIAP